MKGKRQGIEKAAKYCIVFLEQFFFWNKYFPREYLKLVRQKIQRVMSTGFVWIRTGSGLCPATYCVTLKCHWTNQNMSLYSYQVGMTTVGWRNETNR